MDPITQQTVLAAAGAGGDKVYVDDVFSTTLWTGNESLRTIPTGIDNTTKSLIWIKGRDYQHEHYLFDTERVSTNQCYLWAQASNAQWCGSKIIDFESNGFTLDPGSGTGSNQTGQGFVAWNFQAAPGFFDVVTWSGNHETIGSISRSFTHSLGSTPGMIMVKTLSHSSNWAVYHRSLPADGSDKVYSLELDTTSAQGQFEKFASHSEQTSSVFTVEPQLNYTGRTYVAYVFAHDDAQYGTGGNESIIKCGTYTGATGRHVELGFEPQFVMVKCTTSSRTWMIHDSMRGAAQVLKPNENSAESSEPGFNINSTGFNLSDASSQFNATGETYVYMAIRRPHKPPTAATEVFAPTYRASNGMNIKETTGFPVDLLLYHYDDAVNAIDRVRGKVRSRTPYNYAEGAYTPDMLDYSDGFKNASFNGSVSLGYSFKRAPGFFDIVAYSGNGQNRMINHNLAVVPEMYICKKRNGTGPWYVYHSATGNGAFTYFYTNSTSNSSVWNNTSPTATQFSVGANESNVNGSSGTFISYLFATLPGISKVGSYTGTGNDINVNCGFTNGARFVLIKRTDVEIQGTTQDTDWYIWDATRGIVSGNDPLLLLNEPLAQVTNTDYIDPLSTGFTITAGAGNGLNVANKLFIFLAIA